MSRNSLKGWHIDRGAGHIDGLLFLTYYFPFRIFNKVFMPIRLRRCDNKYQETQIVEFYNTIAVVFAVSTAGYTDRKSVIRILYGSI